MSSNSNENTNPAKSGKTEKVGLINQWGGKFAFFFTYVHLSHDLMTGLLPALLPFIRDDLNLNYLQSGFLVTAFALTAGLSQLLGGWVSDKISKRKAITLGLGGVGLSAIAISFAPSYYFLVATLIMLGMFAGFYHPSAISTLAAHVGEQHRGRVVSLHLIGGSLGFGLGPLFGAIIASKLNWHLAWAILGIPALVAGVMVFTRLKIEPGKSAKDLTSNQATGQKPKGVWQVFKPILPIIAISVPMQLVTGPIMSFMGLFLIDVHGLSAAASSMWFTAVRLGGLAGNVVGGWLLDKWGRRNTISLILILFGPLTLLLAKLPFGFAFGAVIILFGVLMPMREATIQTLLMDYSPPHLRARVVGIYFSFGQQGSSVIQPIAGDFMDTWGIGGVYNSIAYISVGLSLLAAILVMRNLRRIKMPGKNAQA